MIFAADHNLPTFLPLPPHIITKFLAYLFEKGTAYGSAVAYLSALSYFHKISSVHDTTKDFNVIQVLKGFKRNRLSATPCQALSFNEVSLLHRTVPALGLDTYPACLFETMLTLGFFLGLRIGEMTASPHNLLFDSITINDGCLKVVFLSFKHSATPSSHILSSSQLESSLCPVRQMKKYVAMRGSRSGPLFLNLGKPVHRNFFCTNFRRVLKRCGFDTKFYSPHSLRVSAARYWASQGLSDSQVRLRGRWRSNAFRKYMRGAVNHD